MPCSGDRLGLACGLCGLFFASEICYCSQIMSEYSTHSGRAAMPDGQSSFRAWPSWNRKLAIPLAGLYAIFLLLIAFLVGSILGNLAREYGQGSNFSELTTGIGFEPVAVAEATGLIDDAAVAAPGRTSRRPCAAPRAAARSSHGSEWTPSSRRASGTTRAPASWASASCDPWSNLRRRNRRGTGNPMWTRCGGSSNGSDAASGTDRSR